MPSPITDIDRSIRRLEGKVVIRTTAPLDIYVNGVTGDDSNPGTAEAPLETIGAAYQLIPDRVSNRVIVHLGPHSGDGYRIPLLRNRFTDKNIYVVGEVDTVLYTGTVAAGSDDHTLVDSVGGFTTDEYMTRSIEILTGAAAGDRRTVFGHDATTITPLAQFSAALQAGDTYRIFEPAVIVREPGPDKSIYWAEGVRGSSTGKHDLYTGIFFVNLTVSLYNILGDQNLVNTNSVTGFYGCNTRYNGLASVGSHDSVFLAGMDQNINGVGAVALGPEADFDLPSRTSWRGWGLAYAQDNLDDSYMAGGFHSGYWIFGDLGHIIRSGNVTIWNCRCPGRIGVLNNSEDPVIIRIYGVYNKIPAEIENYLDVDGPNVDLTLSVVNITTTTNPGIKAQRGAHVYIAGATTIDSGSQIGILAQTGAVVTFSGAAAPTITTTGNDTEVVNAEGVNATRAMSGYDALGKHIAAPDGTVIKRVF